MTNLQQETEIWKSVVGHEGKYEVSNLGRMKALSKDKWNGKVFYRLPEKIMTQSVARKTNYLVVNLIRTTTYAHRIVAMAFIEDFDCKKKDVNHIDGNKQNNRVENLEWCTRKENINHAFKIGLVNIGAKHHASILSDDDAKKVIEIAKTTGEGYFLIWKKHFHHVSKSCIQAVLSGATWKHLER